MKPITEFAGAYRFLSNFHTATVRYRGEEWDTLEHAYQAAKFLNPKARALVQRAATPALAKRVGNRADLKIRPDWEQVKLSVMRQLVHRKFRDPELRTHLLATGDAELVEGNTWGDQFWGVSGGSGLNHLGKTLMAERDWIRQRTG